MMTLTLDPQEIKIVNRQRGEIQVDEFFIASVRKRLLHPIVLRRKNDEIHLVVGGRRLTALRSIGEPLTENVHFRFIEDLSETDARVAELEENVKRDDLNWRDHVRAVAEIHNIYRDVHGANWSSDKTADAIAVSGRWITMCLLIHKNLDSPILREATGIKQARTLLQIAAERRTGQIIGDIIEAGKQIFDNGGIKAPVHPAQENLALSPDLVPDLGTSPDSDGVPGPENSQPLSISDRGVPRTPTPSIPEAVITTDFLEWVKDYSGPKFNVLHVDFPYNIEYKSYAASVNNTDEDYESKGYWELVDGLLSNLDRICSYSAHIIFWFSMEFYEQTRKELEHAGLFVHRHPLIWFKSDNVGVIPGRDNQYPRRVYETAFLCSRGRRSLVRSLANCYPAPTPTGAIHPSQKAEGMLKHFLSMIIDETTDVFDPTAGSGVALDAAEDLGARRVLGLDINPDYVLRANSLINKGRALRSIKL